MKLNKAQSNSSTSPPTADARRVIDILVEPACRKHNLLPGKFDTWDSDGNPVVTASLTPFCDSARELRRRGVPSGAILRMFRIKSNAPDMVAPITIAAELTVIDGARDSAYFSKWKGFSSQAVEAHSDLSAKAATPHAEKQNKLVLESTAWEMS